MQIRQKHQSTNSLSNAMPHLAPPTHANSAHSPCCWAAVHTSMDMQGMSENQGSVWPGALAAACHNMAGVYVLTPCRHGLLPNMALCTNCLRVAGRCNQAVVRGMPSMPCAWRKQPLMRSRTTCDCLTMRRRHCRPTVGSHGKAQTKCASGQQG